MSKVITPTVGRKVWLRLNGRTVEGLSAHDFHTPFDATVVYVWGDRMVNLAARDHDGVPFSITSVPLLQEGDTAPKDNAYCEWMPYPKATADKDATAHLLKLETVARDFIAENRVTCPEATANDRVYENAPELVEKLAEVVGYHQIDPEVGQ